MKGLNPWVCAFAIAISLTGCSERSEAPTPPVKTAESATSSPVEFKAQPLESQEEKRVISAVENQKAADGATVLQVLQYAQKMRPQEFKLRGFEMGYSSDGKPSSVMVCYWLGSKRLDDDQYCDIGYELSSDHKSFKPSVGSATPEEQIELTVSKLNQGRDVFLREIDERYKNECIDPITKKKYC